MGMYFSDVELDCHQAISRNNARWKRAYGLVSANTEKILGLGDVADGGLDDLVALDGGGTFEFSLKVVVVLSHQRGLWYSQDDWIE
jgi:hypothetical protein